MWPWFWQSFFIKDSEPGIKKSYRRMFASAGGVCSCGSGTGSGEPVAAATCQRNPSLFFFQIFKTVTRYISAHSCNILLKIDRTDRTLHVMWFFFLFLAKCVLFSLGICILYT
jgi:hypothetical protein